MYATGAGTNSADSFARFFVWGVWALMFFWALAFIARFGGSIPFWDEWGLFVPVMLGDQPVTPGWVWAPHNEHRLVLPRLLILLLLKLTDNDFRAGMFLNAGLLAGISAAMIRAARRPRGRTSFVDAFFPLALLHVGHAETLLWTLTVQNVLVTMLAGLLLLLIADYGVAPQRLTLGRGVTGGIALLLLPLCGAAGLPFALTVGVWLGIVAVQRLRAAADPGARRDALVFGALSLVAILLVAVYPLGIPRENVAASSPAASLRVAFRFICIGLGAGAVGTGAMWTAQKALVSLLLLLGVGVLGTALRRRQHPDGSSRIALIGFFLFFVAVVGLSLGVGTGRAALSPSAGYTPRYVALSVLGPCWVYFAALVYGPPRVRLWVPTILFTASCALLWINAKQGYVYARTTRLPAVLFERDLRAGASTDALIARYGAVLYSPKDALAPIVARLHRAQVGQFR